MTSHHGSGGMPTPLFRVFNPCAHFGIPHQPVDGIRVNTQTIHAQLKREMQRFTLKDHAAPSSVATLHCRRVPVAALRVGSETFFCPSRSHVVRDSLGYAHGAGPIIVPFMVTPDDSQWWAEGQVDLVNFGWVDADVSLWWLCR